MYMTGGQTDMTKNAPRNKENPGKEKFYFDVNIFDEKEEPLEPPPPMFSEAELAAARKKSFDEGRQQGLKESGESRDQEVAKAIEVIAKNMAILFAAENQREKTYEVEAVRLCLSVFQKAFPLYQEKFGLEELQRHLESILKRQEGQKQILIYVTPALADGITASLAKIKEKTPDLNFSVQGDETLKPGACRLSWADGGAVRNPETLAAEIEGALKELLAGAGTKVHDG
jgi:flagellar assembly protein FliH